MPRPGLKFILGATLFSTPGMKGGLHVSELASIAALVVVIFLALALYQLRGSKREPPNSDGDDGWRKRPDPPPPPPERPSGGIPLDDARPARVRLRGTERLADRLPARARRPGHQPERTPVRHTTSG